MVTPLYPDVGEVIGLAVMVAGAAVGYFLASIFNPIADIAKSILPASVVAGKVDIIGLVIGLVVAAAGWHMWRGKAPEGVASVVPTSGMGKQFFAGALMGYGARLALNAVGAGGALDKIFGEKAAAEG